MKIWRDVTKKYIRRCVPISNACQQGYREIFIPFLDSDLPPLFVGQGAIADDLIGKGMFGNGIGIEHKQTEDEHCGTDDGSMKSDSIILLCDEVSRQIADYASLASMFPVIIP